MNHGPHSRKSPFRKLFLLGVLIVLTPISAFAAGSFAGGVFVEATCDVLYYMSGGLGAMLTAASVLLGISAAAMGDLRLITAAICVALGSYTMGDVVEFFFGDLGCPAANNKSAVVYSVDTAPSDPSLSRSNESEDSESPRSWGALNQ